MLEPEIRQMIINGICETLYMTLASTLVGYLVGLPLGICLAVTDKDGLTPNKFIYKVLDFIVNVLRSIPFLILLILLIPFTRLVVGRSTGVSATVVPLVVAAIPFIARMVESSIKEVDNGVIEAARSMGASNLRIIIHVLITESKTSLISLVLTKLVLIGNLPFGLVLINDISISPYIVKAYVLGIGVALMYKTSAMVPLF